MTLRSHLLKPGTHYAVKSGIFQGDVVRIVDNVTIPDGQPNQRKILINHPSEGDIYMLPRQIDPNPVAGVEVADEVGIVPAPISISLDTYQTDRVMTSLPLLVTSIDPLTDPMDPRLDSFRPDRKRVNEYISRNMPNGLTDIDFLLSFTDDEYRDENQGRPANIMFKGDTQSGKTFLVDILAIKWADRLGLPKPMPVFTLSGSNGITDYDLFGQPSTYTDPETGTDRVVYLHGVADLAARCGGILYVDECNAINERTTTSLHPLADQRHQFLNRAKPVDKGGLFFPEVVNGHHDLWIVGSYNDGGYRGMSDMNEAFINRFRHLAWGYNPQVEEKLIPNAGVRTLGELLRTARTKGVLRTPVGSSSLQRCVLDCQKFGVEMGLGIFMGMFKQQERLQVEEIINSKGIIKMIQDEMIARGIPVA